MVSVSYLQVIMTSREAFVIMLGSIQGQESGTVVLFILAHSPQTQPHGNSQNILPDEWERG